MCIMCILYTLSGLAKHRLKRYDNTILENNIAI